MSLRRTCQNCFQAKIRCDRTHGHDACDRCHRLRKHCVVRPSTRRYNSAMRDARIAALEAQVRNLLGNSGRSSSSAGSSSSPEPQRSAFSAHSFDDRDPVEAGLVSTPYAELLLDTYKTCLTPHFPFVVLSAHVSAAQLRAEKPFLFLAVLSSAAFNDMPTQRQLGHRLKQVVNQRILASGSLTFEVLQGLLVYLAWSHYHSRPRLYTQYLQIAVSIIIDLRLDRAPVSAWKTNVGSHRNPHAKPAAPARSPDEERALAGCFYLSSTVAKLLQKLNTLPHTDYIVECCLSLAQRGAAPTDKYLYHIVRLQHIMENIDLVSTAQPQPVDESATSAAVHAVRNELSNFRAGLPFELHENPSLLMQYHTAELFLCQAALVDWSLGQAQQQHTTQSASSLLHLDVLCTGLAAGKSLLDAYFSLPARAETAFNNSEWIQLSFGLTVAARMAVASTMVGGGVAAATTTADPQQVSSMSQLRHALGMSTALRALATRVGGLATERVDARGDRDVFAQYEKRVQRIRQWFDVFSAPARQLQQLGGAGTTGARGSGASQSPQRSRRSANHRSSSPRNNNNHSADAPGYPQHARQHSGSAASSTYLQPYATEALPMGFQQSGLVERESHQQHQDGVGVGALSFPPPAAQQDAQLPDLPFEFLLDAGASADWMYPVGGPDWLV